LVGHNPTWHKPTPPANANNWIENEVERYHRTKKGRRSCVVLGPNRKEKSHV